MESSVDTRRLPTLRADLEFSQNGVHEDGTPIWIIYDPVQHRYANISWKEHKILMLWRDQLPYEDFLELVRRKTTLTLTEKELVNFIKLLENHLYITFPAEAAAQKLFQKKQEQKARETIWHAWKKMLFMRFKLCNPKRFLYATLPYIRWMFSRYFLYVLLGILLANGYLLTVHWSEFTTQFAYFFNFEGVCFLIGGIVLTKIIHELGHAYASTYYKADITNMGVAILIFFPVLYTDATDSWKLSHRQRIWIDAGGIIAELGLATLATFLWFFLPDGGLRSAVHTAAAISWITSVAINLNPLMRFDGYYLFSDMLQIKNLQVKGFSAATWFLRKKLWGFTQPAPQNLPKKRLRLLIILGFCIWVYRISLFLGIALVMYKFFFKLAGIILFFLEISFFLLLPILKELHHIWRHRKQVNYNKNTTVLLIVIAFILALLFVPWKHSIAVPATLSYSGVSSVYNQKAGKIVKICVKPYQKVEKGQLLASIYSEQLYYDIKRTERDIQKINTRLSSEIGEAGTLGFRQASYQDLYAQKARLEGLRSIEASLDIRAPEAGIIRLIHEGVAVGSYLKKNTLLFEVVNTTSHYRIESFVPERAIAYINWKKQPYFYSKQVKGILVPAKIVSKDLMRTQYLEKLYLSSTSKGDIAAEIDPVTQKIKVKKPYYRVVLEAKVSQSPPLLRNVTVGYVVLGVQNNTLASMLVKKVLAILIRESEF